jgi:hypothetical protein
VGASISAPVLLHLQNIAVWNTTFNTNYCNLMQGTLVSNRSCVCLVKDIKKAGQAA